MGQPPIGRLENDIDSYLWCAVGAILGWCAGGFATVKLTTLRIETMLVAAFGAFIGGEFVTSMIRGAAPRPDGFNMLGFALAIVCALAMLGLLALMRGAVGPLRPSKSKGADRH